jgi:hypothetical protein
VSICASQSLRANIMLRVGRVSQVLRVESPFDRSNRFQTSYIFTPLALAILRLVLCLYTFTTLVYDLIHSAQVDHIDVGRHWSYFTNIAYWSIGFYFLFSSLHGFVYVRTGTAPLLRWPRFFQAAHGILYTTVTTFPILVYTASILTGVVRFCMANGYIRTVVYWTLLAPDGDPLRSRFTAWVNVSLRLFSGV